MTKAIAKAADADGERGVVPYANANLREVLAANFEGDVSQMTPADLLRVTVPAQGRTFELDYGDGDIEPVSTITGVVAHQQRVRRYFRTLYDATVTEAPNCYSPDGALGYGDNETGEEGPHTCATCPLNAWGSGKPREPGEETRAKACSERVDLYLVRRNGLLPFVISVPPTSLRNQRRYMLRLADQAQPYYAVETTLTLEAGDQSSVLTFKRESDLDPETIERVQGYREAIVGLIAAGETQRRAMAEAESEARAAAAE